MTQNNRNLARLTPLLALVLFTLFPFGWLAELWPLADQIGSFIFATEAAHAVGHATIFAAVGATLLAIFPPLRRLPWHYLALIVIVAVAQEGIQLLYKDRGVVLNDITDIGTDLVGAWVVYLIARRGTVMAVANPRRPVADHDRAL